MFRLPINSGFSFSASGSCFCAGLCAGLFGAVVFWGLLCARAGAARSKRLIPSPRLRRADGNLIVILLAVMLPCQVLTDSAPDAMLPGGLLPICARNAQ